VVYVSFDRNYKEFRKHVDMMPWVTLPYIHLKTKQLKFVFNATEVPKLVFLRKDGSIASDDGKELLLRLGRGALDYLKFHQYHSLSGTNNTANMGEQMKRDAFRKEVVAHMFDPDDEGEWGNNYGGESGFDNKPVMGFKSDMEYAFKKE